MGPIDHIRLVAEWLEREGIRYFVTGSFAAMLYGEVRFTRDVDVVVLLRYHDVPRLLATFHQPEYYLEEQAIRRAMQHAGTFNAIHQATHFCIDFIVTDDSLYDGQRFQRAPPS
jgi:hypothetical protein